MDFKPSYMSNSFPTTRIPVGRRPCTKCQYGIFDAPVDGKLNCMEAGTSNIKLLSREEVEEMVFCDKMVLWTKMVLSEKHGDVASDLRRAERILKRR